MRPINLAMGCPDCHGQPHTRETGLTGFLEEVKKGESIMQTLMTMEPNEMYNHVKSATSFTIMLTHTGKP